VSEKPKRLWMNSRWFPLLHLYIEIPFISIRTSLMHYKYEAQLFEYIMLGVRVYKWSTEFKLYGRKEDYR
jgi:hypothetical protein